MNESISEKLREFHNRLEAAIVLAAGTAKQRADTMDKSVLRISGEPLSNWLEQTVNAGYVNLIEQRNYLHELFPELKAESRTLKEHNVEYW